MNREQRICQSCKKEFTIEPEDFLFYEKIKVPAPTFCFNGFKPNKTEDNNDPMPFEERG